MIHTLFVTQDGSPTLVFSNDAGYGEKMHHSGGALTESLFIYHHALGLALERDCPPHVASVGLGLGYNELIALAEFSRRASTNFKIWSFERQDDLRRQFSDWLRGGSPELAPVYDQVLKGVGERLAVENLREFARQALADEKLELRGAFPDETRNIVDVGCYFYDAFSNKMDPDLWAEDTLIANLTRLSAPRAVLATYAATGNLNRALRAAHFRLLERPGFLGKRESTLAIRQLGGATV